MSFGTVGFLGDCLFELGNRLIGIAAIESRTSGGDGIIGNSECRESDEKEQCSSELTHIWLDGPLSRLFHERVQRRMRLTYDQEAGTFTVCSFAPLIRSHSTNATSPVRAGKVSLPTASA